MIEYNTDAEWIFDLEFEVIEAYVEQFRHYKKAPKGPEKSWQGFGP